MGRPPSTEANTDRRVIVIMPLHMYEGMKLFCDERGLPIANGIKLAIKDFLDAQKES